MAFFLDNQIWEILIAELNLWESQFFIDFGVNVNVARNFQPQQAFVPDGLALFISKIHSRRYGIQAHKDKYNSLSGMNEHTERYVMNDTYQIDTQAVSNPSQTSTTIRSADIAESSAAHFQSLDTLLRLKSEGLEIFRIADIKHPHFVNDFDRFEPAPSFDFIISYEQDITRDQPPVEAIFGTTHPI